MVPSTMFMGPVVTAYPTFATQQQQPQTISITQQQQSQQEQPQQLSSVQQQQAQAQLGQQQQQFLQVEPFNVPVTIWGVFEGRRFAIFILELSVTLG